MTKVAILLCGGKGSRMAHLYPNTPKCMIDINGRPFLSRLIEHLHSQGFNKYFISSGHQPVYYSDPSKDIATVRDSKLMGTGWPVFDIFLDYHLEDAWVINGDTFIKNPLTIGMHKDAEVVYTRTLDNVDMGAIYLKRSAVIPESVHEYGRIKRRGTLYNHGLWWDIGTPEGLEWFRTYDRNTNPPPN